MSTAISRDYNAAHIIKSTSTSLLALTPSLAAGFYLIDHRMPLQGAYQLSCFILLLAAADMAGLVMLEPHRQHFAKPVLPAFVSTVTVVLLFIITQSFNQIFPHLGYGFLTPLVAACVGLIYTALFLEKNIVLKGYLSLNSIALMLLWALGVADKITLPF